MITSRQVISNLICILFADGTRLAEDIHNNMDVQLDPDLAFTPATEEWFANILSTIYIQMVTGIREDPKAFAELLETMHLDSESRIEIRSSMHAIAHFGPILYGNNKEFTKAIKARVESLLKQKGARMN